MNCSITEIKAQVPVSKTKVGGSGSVEFDFCFGQPKKKPVPGSHRKGDDIVQPSTQVLRSRAHKNGSVSNKDQNMSTSPTSSSLSINYPAQEDTPGVHFRDALIFSDGQSKPKLVQQSIAAQKIAKLIKNRYAFCGKALAWYRFETYYWRPCSMSEVDGEVTKLIELGTGDIGFSIGYARGVFDLLKKNDLIRLPERVPGVIPFKNGLLDLSKRQLIPATPENASTWVLPCDYAVNAQCPNFLKWLNICVDSDVDTIQLLRSWTNAVLIGRPSLQIFLHIIGPAGTGKSTFGRLIFKIVGTENATTTTLRQLETNRFEAANIHGKRVVMIEEADRYGGSVSVLKSMTGQDPLRLERKNQQQSGSFIFDGQTILMSNERFITSDNTSGIERRRITVEFKHRTTPAERAAWNAQGGEDAILYKEIPGIINWALRLSDQEVEEIFKKIPERVRKANLEAARTNNPMIDWMLTNLVPCEESFVQVGIKQEVRVDGEVSYKDAAVRLYPNYLTWCLQNGRESLSIQRFTSVLKDVAESYNVTIQKKREKSGVKIFGLRIRHEDEDSWLSRLESEDLVYTETQDKSLIMKEMKEMNTIPISSTQKNVDPVVDSLNDDDLEVVIHDRR